jgi:ribonuclease III
MDMGDSRPLEPHWRKLLIQAGQLAWITDLIGRPPLQPRLFLQALTHGSASSTNYERLEFLGDRVLGLIISEWLFESFADESEGRLSHRLNMLVSGEVCADIARAIGVQPHIVLGKQARDDGAIDSTNVLGDIMEAIIGALFIDGGIDDARRLLRRLWAEQVEGTRDFAKHPKSALQEWSAANKRKAPEYTLSGRSGPDHALQFTVTVMIRNVGEASATGASKQEAETLAARALLEKIT